MSVENYLKLQFIAISAKLKFQKSQKQFPTTRNSRIHIRIKGFQTVQTILEGFFTGVLSTYLTYVNKKSKNIERTVSNLLKNLPTKP